MSICQHHLPFQGSPFCPFFPKQDASFSNDVGKVEHPSLNGDWWRNKNNNVHIPWASNVVGRSSGFLFGNQKAYFQRHTRNLSCKKATCWVHPPHTGMQKKTPGWRLYILESQNQTLRETILKVWCFTRDFHQNYSTPKTNSKSPWK